MAAAGLAHLRRALRDALAKRQPIQITGATDPYVHMGMLAGMGALETGQAERLVIVVPRSKDVNVWTDFLQFNLPSSEFIGAVLPFHAGWGRDRYVNPHVQRRQRVYALANAPRQRSVVVTTVQALAQLTLPLAQLEEHICILKVGAEYDQEDLIADFEDLGYNTATSVDEEGTYAVKGGIVDVYPLNHLHPIRLEFFGDELSSVRYFSISSQRSFESLQVARIAPAYEAFSPAVARKDHAQRLFNHLLDIDTDPSDRDGMVAAFQQGARFSGFEMFLPLFRPQSVATVDYFQETSAFVFPQTLDSCLEAYDEFLRGLDDDYKSDLTQGKPTLSVDQHFADFSTMQSKMAMAPYRLEFGNPFEDSRAVRIPFTGPPLSFSPNDGQEAFDKGVEKIQSILANEGTAVVLAHHTEQLERISNLLTHRQILSVRDPDLISRLLSESLDRERVYLGIGSLPGTVYFEESRTLVTTDEQLLGGTKRKSRPPSQKLQNYLSSFKDLQTGDLIVHVQHGIGRYLGMENLEVGGLATDFLVLEYAGGDKIYMPVDRLSLLQRYSSGQDQVARVDKLGGPQWEKRKSKARQAIRDMAEELLKLQAQRTVSEGHSFSAPDESYLKFEASFPYEETTDQIRALMDIEADVRSSRPMDRLICGDVGFGKTEIALRTAYRAVLEGYQVLVLVPTTVLCYQHYRTFVSRLDPFGVRVGMVNRFVGTLAAKEVTKGLENGSVDILIGTHRLLSKDVKPKRLGLLVVDEEQRFGVGHKEKLKHLRAQADILTLTATPIPRTLHMSMVGLRDISIIATPPQDRLSVKTYIAKFDEALIREAIEHEVKRGGQIFFVHNRVQDIDEMAGFLRSLVPHLEIRTAHGQMREHQLEKVIINFIEQKFPILVCTTIIESGIDMPNVNTLIVNRADRFGLAQLYQLRGRVGRSNHQAYAYFLTPDDARLSEDAKKRLDILAAHQELGAGFQIASHDLELRGAGNLLGGEQTGHASAVGLELYTEMLEQAIQGLRGEPIKERIDTEIKLPVAAVIPKSYIKDENQRLQTYKTLFSAEDVDELREIGQDLADRYGTHPRQLMLLMGIARLKQQLRGLGAKRIAASGGKIVEIQFFNLQDAQIDRILQVTRRDSKIYKLAPDNRLLIFTPIPRQPSMDEQEALIKHLTLLLEPLL